MSTHRTFESASIETLTVQVQSPVAPDTAQPPQFQLTPAAATSPASTGWVPGVWDNENTARTPLIGAGQPLDITGQEHQALDLWIRWTAGNETPVRYAATLLIK